MKTSLSKALVLGLLVALVVALPVLAAPSFGTPQPTYPASFEGITPALVPGNFGGDVPACEKLYGAENVTDNMVSFYVDPPVSYSDDYLEVIVSDDGKYVAWETTNANMLAFVMKGGSDHHIYDYVGSGISSDSWLASPEVAQGNIPEISHYAGCYEIVPEECEWIGETAWAAGIRYSTERGQWATYTPYVADSSVILYAGQNMDAGTVHFSEAVGGFVTITITLNDGWRFAVYPDDMPDDNVKIQDYEFAPSGNPSPGGFAYKAYAESSPFSIDVPENNFYGVHVDVEWEYCPMP